MIGLAFKTWVYGKILVLLYASHKRAERRFDNFNQKYWNLTAAEYNAQTLAAAKKRTA